MVGSLNISKKKNHGFVQVTSNSDFFSTPIKYDIKDGCIFFRKCSIDDNKRVLNPTKMKSKGWYLFNIKIDQYDIKFGKYDFDEDSTDEEIIVCYNNEYFNK